MCSDIADVGEDAMPQPVFELEALTKTYRTGEVEVHALRGADAVLNEGELHGNAGAVR